MPSSCPCPRVRTSRPRLGHQRLAVPGVSPGNNGSTHATRARGSPAFFIFSISSATKEIIVCCWIPGSMRGWPLTGWATEVPRAGARCGECSRRFPAPIPSIVSKPVSSHYFSVCKYPHLEEFPRALRPWRRVIPSPRSAGGNSGGVGAHGKQSGCTATPGHVARPSW